MLRGGIRSRLVVESLRVAVIDALTQLNWFVPSDSRITPQYARKPEEWDEVIAFNTFSITVELDRRQDVYLGNDPNRLKRFYIDFFAENDAVADDFAWTVADILAGKYPDLGRIGPILDVFDLRTDEPTQLTTVGVEDIRVDRVEGYPRNWQTHWIVTSCFIEDEYLDELPGRGPFDAEWTDDMQAAWDLVRAVSP